MHPIAGEERGGEDCRVPYNGKFSHCAYTFIVFRIVLMEAKIKTSKIKTHARLTL